MTFRVEKSCIDGCRIIVLFIIAIFFFCYEIIVFGD